MQPRYIAIQFRSSYKNRIQVRIIFFIFDYDILYNLISILSDKNRFTSERGTSLR